jgi:hypothetical protein
MLPSHLVVQREGRNPRTRTLWSDSDGCSWTGPYSVNVRLSRCSDGQYGPCTHARRLMQCWRWAVTVSPPSARRQAEAGGRAASLNWIETEERRSRVSLALGMQAILWSTFGCVCVCVLEIWRGGRSNWWTEFADKSGGRKASLGSRLVGRRQLSADAGVFLLDQGCLLVVTGGMVRDRVWSGVRDLWGDRRSALSREGSALGALQHRRAWSARTALRCFVTLYHLVSVFDLIWSCHDAKLVSVSRVLVDSQQGWSCTEQEQCVNSFIILTKFTENININNIYDSGLISYIRLLI